MRHHAAFLHSGLLSDFGMAGSCWICKGVAAVGVKSVKSDLKSGSCLVVANRDQYKQNICAYTIYKHMSTYRYNYVYININYIYINMIYIYASECLQANINEYVWHPVLLFNYGLHLLNLLWHDTLVGMSHAIIIPSHQTLWSDMSSSPAVLFCVPFSSHSSSGPTNTTYSSI